MTPTIWLDCSNYADVPTPNQVTALRSLGIDGAIVGTSYGFKSAGQIAAFSAGGMHVEEYQFPQALVAARFPWWADAEQAVVTRDMLRAALARGARGVYSRSGFWSDQYGSWDVRAEFPAAELWDARYIGTVQHGLGDSDPCLIQNALRDGGDVRAAILEELSWLSPFRPYGGFDAAAITQFHNSVTIYGLNVDLNVIEGEHMPTPEFDELFERDEAIKAVLKTVNDRAIAALTALFDLAKHVYGDSDPRTLDVEQRLKALEGGDK